MSTQPVWRSLNQISPWLGSKARRIRRLVVVLPQPDSPTRARLSPGRVLSLPSPPGDAVLSELMVWLDRIERVAA